MDQEFDPLQSEPKKFKMGNDEFPSNDCEYVASRAHSLKRHVEIKHIEKTYSCDECEFVSTTAYFLKVHVESIHEGVRYPCPQCEHAATVKTVSL